ncbi:MAG: transglycosylase domain-containing protein [Candidatus Pacebacteria bacterium]|nr:transglycosylase domain-containing protein [Candidatus Paceibacterota bacterium]MBP9839381.1 transglycosylase domain-containing protein [Candidatus Paceibacterota bacterium]
MLRSKKKKRLFNNLLIFTAGLIIVVMGISTIFIASFKIPDFSSFGDRKIVNSTKIYDRTGEVLLYDIHQDIRRTNIAFEDMGSHIKNATVAVEDAEFYNHSGVRISSTIRAVLSNVFNVGIGGGGSTITQQLVKNTLLNSKKTIGRKIREWVLAVKIDNALPKEKILELYLNEAPYGGTVYGIEEAAKTYFNKKAYDMTIAEAAYMASIPQSPTYLSPYGKNKDKLEERKNFVLFRMKELGFITEEDYTKAKDELVEFVPKQTSNIKAPHFVFFIKDYLENKYGAELVENGGLKVTTTLDYTLQEQGEKIVKEGALENQKNWDGSNAALVAINPKTGEILSMIGSRDYFDKEIDGNYNVATALRQPGSSFKPFIYATAFNKGFTPDTVLFDLPTEFQSTCNAYGTALPGHNQSDCYMPQNYDGKWRGPMKLRDALGQSINIPAVKLFYLSGLKDSLDTAENMGINTLKDISRYGLTLVIGGGEVSLLDITSAYGVFANEGVRVPYTGVLKVEDINGNVLEEINPNGREVLPRNTALTISDILSDNVARTPTFGANSSLNIPGRDVAVKTGTTNNNKDAWTVGYTPSIVVGVWAGNNDNKPMKKGGVSVAGPIWNKFLNESFKNIPNEKFEKPDLYVDPTQVKPVLRGYWQGNENFFIDKISGKLATEHTPIETRVEKVVTNVHSILYWIDRDDILGDSPKDPSDNAQFRNWETPIQNWWAQNKNNYKITTWNEMPSSYDDIHKEDSKPEILIKEPNETTTYSPDTKIQIEISNKGKYSIQKIEIFVNDIYLGATGSPFKFSFFPNDLENLREENKLTIIAYDSAFNRGEFTSYFKVSK